MPTCSNCHGTNTTPVAKPGRQLAGYARSSEGTKLIIPADLVIDTCACGLFVPTDTQKEALAEFERDKVRAGAFPL